MSTVYSISFSSWSESVSPLLDQAGLDKLIGNNQKILIKPNLVEVLPPPITTPVALVESIVDYLLSFIPPSSIIIGEGCGASHHDTTYAFNELGYITLARRKKIELIDLNTEPLVLKTDINCRRWPEMFLPKILDSVFLLSVPQLKAHSLAGVTLTMKSMMGCAPPSHYKGGGAWKKSSFHHGIHEAIYDLNRYRTPDFTILDATIGMAKAHLWGPKCKPAVGLLAASSDPVAIDSYGTALLGKKWQNIEHIAKADGMLGSADNFRLVECHGHTSQTSSG